LFFHLLSRLRILLSADACPRPTRTQARLAGRTLYALFLRGAPFLLTPTAAAAARATALAADHLPPGLRAAWVAKDAAWQAFSVWGAPSLVKPLWELSLLLSLAPTHAAAFNFLWRRNGVGSSSSSSNFALGRGALFACLPLNLAALVLVRFEKHHDFFLFKLILNCGFAGSPYFSRLFLIGCACFVVLLPPSLCFMLVLAVTALLLLRCFCRGCIVVVCRASKWGPSCSARRGSASARGTLRPSKPTRARPSNASKEMRKKESGSRERERNFCHS
jgi:hypothetical protein